MFQKDHKLRYNTIEISNQKTQEDSRPSVYLEGPASTSTYLDAQPLYVIQAVDKTLHISAMAKLICHVVHFELSAIGIVVVGVTVDISVQEDCVEREAPIRRRGMIRMIRPASPVVDRRDGRGVLVQVEANLGWIIPESLT